jgi:hypothetical protein
MAKIGVLFIVSNPPEQGIDDLRITIDDFLYLFVQFNRTSSIVDRKFNRRAVRH